MEYLTTMDELREIFNQMKSYSSKEKNRPTLVGVQIKLTDGKPYAYATNGYRVLEKKLNGELVDGDEYGFKVPIVKLSKDDGEVRIVKTNEGVEFILPNGTLRAESDHQFPDVDSLFSRESETRDWIGFEATNLLESLKALVKKGKWGDEGGFKMVFETDENGEIRKTNAVRLENRAGDLVSIVMPMRYKD